MEIVFEVPDDRAEFMLEMLRSIRFLRNPRALRTRIEAASTVEKGTTDNLLSSGTNAEHLKRSFEQLDGRATGA